MSLPLSRRTLPIVRAVARRDFDNARSYRAGYLLEAGSALLGVSIYYFISETFAAAPTDNLSGAPSYFAFALVGVVLTVVIQSSTLGLARRIRDEQLTGTLEAVAVQPVRDAELGLGFACYPFLYSGIRAAVYLLGADLVLGVDFSKADWLGLTLVLLATTGLFFALGLVFAALVMLIKQAQAVAALGTMALALLGGAYFPVEVLPSWLEPLATIAPPRLAYDGAREALYTGSGWGDDVLGLVLIAVVFVPVGLWLFAASLRWQRKHASLGEY
jgi:ABC-2 type transport system permease protein